MIPRWTILGAGLVWTLPAGAESAPPLPPPAPHRTWVVAPGTAVPTLGRALELAGRGDTIVVRAGEYREPELQISYPVTIRGEGGPVFHGGEHQIFRITGDSVTLTGLVLQDVVPSAVDDRAAIKVIEASACRIEGNTLRNTFFGIYLQKVTGCTLRANRVVGNATTEALTGNAIHSWNSSNLVVENNELRSHRDGIYFEFTTDAVVRDNISTRNTRYGMHFMFSHSCHYTRNSFLENGAGVAVMYSHKVTMEENRFERSWGSAAYGLLLKEISDGRVTGNRFAGNSIGMVAEGTTRMAVEDNEFLENGWAVQVLASAQATTFHRNRFEGNSFDVSSNSVNASSEFRENFWDRYTGYDLDRDGYGDIPFPPVRLFSLVVQQNPPALILLRSFFVSLLDAAERVAPVLTPALLADPRPLMEWSPARRREPGALSPPPGSSL